MTFCFYNYLAMFIIIFIICVVHLSRLLSTNLRFFFCFRLLFVRFSRVIFFLFRLKLRSSNNFIHIMRQIFHCFIFYVQNMKFLHLPH